MAHKLRAMDISAMTSSIKDFKFHLPDRAIRLGVVKNSGDMFTKMKADGNLFLMKFDPRAENQFILCVCRGQDNQTTVPGSR